MKKNIIYSILLMICANLAVAVDFKEGATTGKVVKNVEESPDKKILNWGNLQKNSAKNFLNENPDVRNAKKLTLACSDKYLGVLIFEKIIVHLEELQELTFIGRTTFSYDLLEEACLMSTKLNSKLKKINYNSDNIDLAKLSAVNPNLIITKLSDKIVELEEKQIALKEQKEESPSQKILNWGNLQKNSAKNFLNENPDVRNATELDLEYLDEELGSLIIGIIARLKKLEKLTLIGCTLECEWIEVMCEMFSVLNPELKNLHIDRNSVYIDLAKLSAVNPNLTITQTKSTDVILKEKEKKKELEEQNENNLKLKNFLANEPKKKKNSFDSDDSFTSTEAVKNEGIEYPTKQ